MMNRARRVLVLGLMLGASACADVTVVRVFGAREVEGRFIGERAYAKYASAADAEARGALHEALTLYRASLDDDPTSPEIQARIGAVLCAINPDDPAARIAFAKAEELGQSDSVYAERARCEAKRGDSQAALIDATRAMNLDPERIDMAVLRAHLLENSGDADAAARELAAITVRSPGAAEAWRARLDTALRHHDDAIAVRSAKGLIALVPSTAPALAVQLPALGELARIDDAIARGNDALAKSIAMTARIQPAELAIRAAALASPALALEQAHLALTTDAMDTNARVALAVGESLRRSNDSEAFAPIAPSFGPASRLARALMAELLLREVGRDGALALWCKPPEPSTDALVESTERRVIRRLAELEP
jgi:tetratricopeptide (TPR) repeat protein